jgi:hypothetical protein
MVQKLKSEHDIDIKQNMVSPKLSCNKYLHTDGFLDPASQGWE